MQDLVFMYDDWPSPEDETSLNEVYNSMQILDSRR